VDAEQRTHLVASALECASRGYVDQGGVWNDSAAQRLGL
jgi:hypothetical protein